MTEKEWDRKIQAIKNKVDSMQNAVVSLYDNNGDLSKSLSDARDKVNKASKRRVQRTQKARAKQKKSKEVSKGELSILKSLDSTVKGVSEKYNKAVDSLYGRTDGEMSSGLDHAGDLKKARGITEAISNSNFTSDPTRSLYDRIFSLTVADKKEYFLNNFPKTNLKKLADGIDTLYTTDSEKEDLASILGTTRAENLGNKSILNRVENSVSDSLASISDSVDKSLSSFADKIDISLYESKLERGLKAGEVLSKGGSVKEAVAASKGGVLNKVLDNLAYGATDKEITNALGVVAPSVKEAKGLAEILTNSNFTSDIERRKAAGEKLPALFSGPDNRTFLKKLADQVDTLYTTDSEKESMASFMGAKGAENLGNASVLNRAENSVSDFASDMSDKASSMMDSMKSWSLFGENKKVDKVKAEKTPTKSKVAPTKAPKTAAGKKNEAVAKFSGISIDDMENMPDDELWEYLVDKDIIRIKGPTKAPKTAAGKKNEAVAKSSGVSADDMENMSDDELAAKGIIRIKGFTRRDGVKIKTHYRKIGK